MRIDKFLKVSRLLKRRTVAKEAVSNKKVLVNDKIVKPSFQVQVGDVVEVLFNSAPVKFKILDVKETVKKEEADSLFEIIGD